MTYSVPKEENSILFHYTLDYNVEFPPANCEFKDEFLWCAPAAVVVETNYPKWRFNILTQRQYQIYQIL